MTSTATTTPATAPREEAPPAPAEMKCTLCGLSACWTEKDAPKGG